MLPNNHELAGAKAFPMERFQQEPYIETYPKQDIDNARVFERCGIRPNTQFSTMDIYATVSNQLRVPSKTKPRIVAGFKTSCNGLDIFLEFQAPREAVHPESLNLCHSYVWEFR